MCLNPFHFIIYVCICVRAVLIFMKFLNVSTLTMLWDNIYFRWQEKRKVPHFTEIRSIRYHGDGSISSIDTHCQRFSLRWLKSKYSILFPTKKKRNFRWILRAWEVTKPAHQRDRLGSYLIVFRPHTKI